MLELAFCSAKKEVQRPSVGKRVIKWTKNKYESILASTGKSSGIVTKLCSVCEVLQRWNNDRGYNKHCLSGTLMDHVKVPLMPKLLILFLLFSHSLIHSSIFYGLISINSGLYCGFGCEVTFIYNFKVSLTTKCVWIYCMSGYSIKYILFHLNIWNLVNYLVETEM